MWYSVILCSFQPIFAAKVYYDLVYQRSIGAPDGFSKSIITVNGIFPGPELSFNVNDEAVVTVTNMLGENQIITVHWHGIDQIGTPWSDGTGGVTNCPIQFRTNYTYVFTLSEAGTFWYHIHLGANRGEGGYGYLIVNENVPIANYDLEGRLLLSDWYHQAADYIETGLLNYGPTGPTGSYTGFTWPGNGNAILVNSKGNQPVYIDVLPNMIYRFRILSSSVLQYFYVSIAGHNMTVISSGSTPVEPVNVTVLEVNSASRYDVLINTHNMPAMLYRITIETNYRGNDNTASGIFSNVFLRYQGGSNTISPLKPANTSQPWYHQIGLLKTRRDYTELITAPDVEVIFNMSQQYTNASTLKGLSYTASNTNGFLRWTVNQQSYEFPSTPLLLSSYYNMLNRENYESASLPIPVKYNDMVQIVIQNRAALNGVCEQHPWHLHGTVHYTTVQYSTVQ